LFGVRAVADQDVVGLTVAAWTLSRTCPRPA
jgi:hypothetical protein